MRAVHKQKITHHALRRLTRYILNLELLFKYLTRRHACILAASKR